MECQTWHGQPFCQFWRFGDFSLSSYGQTISVKLTTWRYNLDLWPLRLWGHRACGSCGSPYSIHIPSLQEVCRPSHCEDTVTALSGLLTFDLSTSKWGHGFPVSWASFLPIFSLLRSSILDLGSGVGQTDRRTDGQRDDGHHCIVPIQGDGGIIIIVNNNNKRRLKYPLTNCHKGSCEQSVTISHKHQVSVNSWNQVLKSLEIRARAVFQNNFSETGRSSTIFERRVVIQLMIKSLIWVENHLCFFHRKSSYSRT